MTLGDLYHFIRFSDGELREMPLYACVAHLDAAEPHIRERMQIVMMRVVAYGEDAMAPTLRPSAPIDTCIRCGAPYGIGGFCSKRHEGCQGGRGEATFHRSELPTLSDEVPRAR